MSILDYFFTISYDLSVVQACVFDNYYYKLVTG